MSRNLYIILIIECGKLTLLTERTTSNVRRKLSRAASIQNFLSSEKNVNSGQEHAIFFGFRALNLLLGPVCRMSQELFGLEKPFVNLPTACSGEPIF